jgi:hypothetical protein
MKPCRIHALQLTLLLFSWSVLAPQEPKENAVIPARRNTEKSIEVKSVKLFSWQSVGRKRTYREVKEFRETEGLHLEPTDKIDAVCEVKGGPRLSPEGDFFVWTTVDFVLAPANQEAEKIYAKMDIERDASNALWGRVSAMEDLKAVPVYSLQAGETRRIVVSNFNLEKVIETWAGNPNSLWPWLVRFHIHVQDRNGVQVTQAARVFRLLPNFARTPNG